jgi:hypothetical protein
VTIATLAPMRRPLRTLLAVLAFAFALVPATAAHAQQGDPNGVQVDPNTPSGHEYDIPVQKARRQASGSSKKKSSAGAAASTNGSSGGGGSNDSGLFGAGVTSDDSSSGSSGSSSSSTSSQDDSGTTTADTGTTSTPTETQATTAAAQPTTAAAQPATTTDASNGSAAIAAADQGTGGPGPTVAFGVGGLVLLLAGLGGWLVKRRFA